MIGKSLTQLVRLAMVLQVLNVACTELYGLPGSDHESEYTDEFIQAANEKIAQINPEMFIINIDIVNRAKKLLDYFNLNKLVLSSYNIDPHGTFSEAFDKICEGRPVVNTVSNYFASLPAKAFRYELNYIKI